MPRISHFEILQKNAQPTLSLRTRTTVEKLPMLIGETYGKIAAYLKDIGQLLGMSLLLLTIMWICQTSM